jgi:hypothetical protein
MFPKVDWLIASFVEIRMVMSIATARTFIGTPPLLSTETRAHERQCEEHRRRPVKSA